jgi:hypothetical protein
MNRAVRIRPSTNSTEYADLHSSHVHLQHLHQVKIYSSCRRGTSGHRSRVQAASEQAPLRPCQSRATPFLSAAAPFLSAAAPFLSAATIATTEGVASTTWAPSLIASHSSIVRLCAPLSPLDERCAHDLALERDIEMKWTPLSQDTCP